MAEPCASSSRAGRADRWCASADDGPGIPLGAQGRIFELFFTTRSDGTGMGLATVKKLVERQGGSVTLERSDPRGTIFRLELPS